MNGTLPDHLIVAPILIPFVAGALMLFYDDRARAARLPTCWKDRSGCSHPAADHSSRSA